MQLTKFAVQLGLGEAGGWVVGGVGLLSLLGHELLRTKFSSPDNSMSCSICVARPEDINT